MSHLAEVLSTLMFLSQFKLGHSVRAVICEFALSSGASPLTGLFGSLV